MKQKIEFSLIENVADEMRALALLIAGLNQSGVPWSIRRDKVAIELTISTGF